ncbi:MAG: aminotransferase class V-fold PLP-dependent enzyme [Planctomycetales bacterium]|nr:aminotransferase class V-fold PLP-dependent enzyme [Planctomycetales bacterium]
MHTEHYLDTARLGRMCDGARSAEHDFGWLVSRLGSSLYLERFLSRGYDTLPRRFARRVPRLRCWSGIAGLSVELGDFIRQPANLPTHFFGQSASLSGFAAECLFRNANRVLTTDLEWPAYRNALRATAIRHGKALITIPMLKRALYDRVSASEIVELIADTFTKYACDGIFLSDISYLGQCMPVEQLLRRLERDCRFSVIDGAQAFNQRPVALNSMKCDLYLTGTQKWLCSYHPLRIAFVGRNANVDSIEKCSQDSVTITDPLYHFCNTLTGGQSPSFGETVNVVGLISAAGALKQMRYHSFAKRQLLWHSLKANSRAILEWLDLPRRQLPNIDSSLQSGITLLRTPNAPACSNADIRHTLAENRIIASTFPEQLLRLSMPKTKLSLSQMTTVQRAFYRLATT